MYAESGYSEWIARLCGGSFLFCGVPRVVEVCGPGRLGIEPGHARSLYLFDPVLVVEPEVAGVRFWARESDLRRLAPGRTVRLVRERGNRYDPSAVRVCGQDGAKLGYVPRFAARLVASRIDLGGAVYARVRRSDWLAKRLVIQIYFLNPGCLAK